MRKKNENSINHQSHPKTGYGWDQLSVEMQQTLGDYAFSLHGIGEDSRKIYLVHIKKLGQFLMNNNITRFEDAQRHAETRTNKKLDSSEGLGRLKKKRAQDGIIRSLKTNLEKQGLLLEFRRVKLVLVDLQKDDKL